MSRICRRIASFVFVVSLPVPACTSSGSGPDYPTYEEVAERPTIFDPGPKPLGGGGYGSGYGGSGGGLAGGQVDCAAEPCIHGDCVDGDGSEPDACECDEGYTGARCDACADGYSPEGLGCVASGPCSSSPCVHGTCLPDGSDFSCECAAGYDGDVCDKCASGYHQDGLKCLPD